MTYIVSDDTGVASVTFWDKLATQFMNNSLDQLKLSLEPVNVNISCPNYLFSSYYLILLLFSWQKKRMTGIPKELDMQMGKKLLLKLKISKYNADNPRSSLNIIEYTVCEDLMQQFDAATSEVSMLFKQLTQRSYDNIVLMNNI